MRKVGIDLGTTFVKTSSEICFPSGISEIIYPNNDILEINNKQYTMGLYNINDININKSLNNNSRLNFLYALFLESPNEETYFDEVICGLPCSQWKNSNTVIQFKKSILTENTIEIKVNGVQKKVTIDSLNIIPEGSTAYYTNEMNNFRFNGEKVLLLDWGGRTLNCLLFENDDLIDTHTEEFGVLSLYPDLAEKISTETGISIKNEQAFNIIKDGLFFKGQFLDVNDFISPIIYKYCNDVYKFLQLRFNVDTIKHVPLIGGGSIIMNNYIQKYIPQSELQPNAQLLTAIGMGEGAI
jgi:hypothetical protein